MPVIQLSDEEELCEAVKNAGRKLVVLAFSSGNCGPCKLTNPRLEVYQFQGGNPDYLCRTVEELRFQM
ncbi:hypothetical protein GDO81_001469 [Engystomops pustulosus]|uniref:Thioredoxin domain-containing protein n=1 Tax=Engystomops pustulosus TaxID=76066 RepID=A0AAV7DCQ5_ENGPU|nr:hypothetical protein GDO81_001469 [Engystomops pustulosus]